MSTTKLSVVVCALALQACGTMPENRSSEIAWQVLNVADGLQTSQYQHNDCVESGAWKAITGPEPSVRDTVVAAALNGVLHYTVTRTLELFDASPALMRFWSYSTIGVTGAQVIKNQNLRCAR